jgi:methyltransferase
MKRIGYTAILVAVGLGRLIELGISRRRQRRLIQAGVAMVPERQFRAMVLLHTGVLAAAALEVWLLKSPFVRLLALPMTLLFLAANVLRWWVIATLAEHWNVRVMDSVARGVVTHGPYRWIRHPNYAAVFLELLALPLIYSAWLTALLGGVAHVWVLRQRITTEEAILMAHPAYRRAMGTKPRFLPFLPRWGGG